MYYQDVRGAASAAHVYGKPIVAASRYTGGGYESPYTLKQVSDFWLAQGINRLVFHTSAHQPLDTKPGNTMVGTHLQPEHHLGGTGEPVFHLSGAPDVHAAAGASGGGPALSAG